MIEEVSLIMNIGLFTDTYFPQINGVGTSVHTLSQSLTKLGHNVYIFTPSDPKQDPDEDNHIIRMPSMPFVFIRQYRTGLLYSPKELFKITHLHLDIVHTQTEFSLGVFGKTLSKTLNIPMVHTYHTMYEDYVHYIVNGALITPTMAKEFSRIFCNSANAVVAPTDKVKHFLNNYGVINPISVIPTGINIDKFRKSNFTQQEILDLKTELGLDLNSPIILSLGRVAKEKSIDVIINAMPELLSKIPNAKLVIVGDGPYRTILVSLVATLNIAENVIFTGAKPWDEIGKYYQLGDVFVSASITETQGLTFIEAMAAGMPVIAKNDECIQGVVKHEENGLLFENNEDLSDRLYEVLSDNEKRKKLAENSLNYVETVSADAFGKNVESLYYEILENPKKYSFHKHPNFSPIILGKRAAKKISQLNSEIGNDIIKKSKTLVHIASIPKNKVVKRYRKFKNKEIE